MYYAFSVQQARLVQCRDCGHMMLHPPPAGAERDRFRDDQLHENNRGRQEFSRLKEGTARLYLDLVRRCRGGHGGRLLEIGSGTGELLSVAAELGYEATGVEISEEACIRARQRHGDGIRIVRGGIDSLPEKNYYDVCIVADAIEHVIDPRFFLDRVYDLLTPAGVVIVATPSLESWSARVMRNRWLEFKLQHLHYFTLETLHSLLFRAGLQPIGAVPGRKCLSVDYVAGRFRTDRVPVLSSALDCMSQLLPASIRRTPFQAVAGGIVSVAVKTTKTLRRTLSIIIPAYNEAATIGPVLQSVVEKRLEGLDTEVIIVESNSTDGTREIVTKYQGRPGVKVILEDRPRGKGHAVRTGLAYATGDYILIQDADQEYDIEDYDVLIEPLLTGSRAFVLGSRHGGRTWKVRQFKGKPFTGTFLNFGHWVFKTAVNLTLGLDLDDPFTMYKVFRRDCIAGLCFESNRFDFDYELLFKIVRKGYRPIEIPVNYRSRSFSEGKKVSIIRDPWTWVRAIIKFGFARLDPIAGWRASAEPVSRSEIRVMLETDAVLADSGPVAPH